MKKLGIGVALTLAMLIPLIIHRGSKIGQSGITMRYLNVEWLGYGFTVVFGVEDLSEDYAEITKEIIERDEQ